MKCNIFLLPMLFILISCGTENISKKSTAKYQPFYLNDGEFVVQFNKFINDIKVYSSDGFNGFIVDSYEKPINTKSAYLFGEHHLDIEGKKRTFAFISNLAQKSPVLVLEEGGDASDKIKKDNFSKLTCILSLFLEQKFVEIYGVGNYAQNIDKWLAAGLKEHFKILLQQLEETKIDLGGLGLKNMSFGNWDSSKHRAGEVNFSNTMQRNQSMLVAINKNGQPITVILAGFFHVPLGEHYLSVWRDKKFANEKPINWEEYYSLAESTRKEKQKQGTLRYYDEFLGSTEVLYRGLRDSQWNFIQAIPKSSLSLWESQTPKGS